VLTHVLNPYSAEAVSPSAASQLVYYHDSAVLLSPYHVQEQVTYIKTPGNTIEYSTTVHPTSRAGAEVKYGAYYDQEPGTFWPISFHYENRPFVVFEKLERKVDILYRGHIRVTDEYKMRQDHAWYKRIFSRYG
jgi:oligosaccharyltransferase complex subunit alpha (ribophorin I)